MEDKILIVDDARFARNLIKRALNNGGYTNLIEAESAQDAIRLFTNEHPNLTLLDITLSDRNDLSLLADLISIRPDAKIVMSSAIGQQLIIADALQLGAMDYIVKPFEQEHLLEVVASALSEKGENE